MRRLQMMDDGEMMFDREFMMNIFEPIVDQVEPFAEYLEFIFENKEGHALGSRDKADKWLPFDELRAELFFPLGTMFVKPIPLLVAWQKLLLPPS